MVCRRRVHSCASQYSKSCEGDVLGSVTESCTGCSCTCLKQLQQDVLQVGEVLLVASSQLLARPLPLRIPQRLQAHSMFCALVRMAKNVVCSVWRQDHSRQSCTKLRQPCPAITLRAVLERLQRIDTASALASCQVAAPCKHFNLFKTSVGSLLLEGSQTWHNFYIDPGQTSFRAAACSACRSMVRCRSLISASSSATVRLAACSSVSLDAWVAASLSKAGSCKVAVSCRPLRHAGRSGLGRGDRHEADRASDCLSRPCQRSP